MQTVIALSLDRYAHAVFLDTLAVYKQNLPANIDRFILPQNFHITLAFLGEIDSALLPVLTENLQKLAATVKPFAICLRELKYFPSDDHPKVLAAIIDETPELMDLALNVDTMLKKLYINYSCHYTFRPHLSVAYCNDVSWTISMLPKMLLNISSTINAITIFESHTESNNDRYKLLAEVNFESN